MLTYLKKCKALKYGLDRRALRETEFYPMLSIYYQFSPISLSFNQFIQFHPLLSIFISIFLQVRAASCKNSFEIIESYSASNTLH